MARDHISIVGSSTVFPFSTVVAEDFGKTTNFNTPVVESTGTGGGFKLFCSGVGSTYPDITNASRQVKQSEIDLCASNGITMSEHMIGFDGIVIANTKAHSQFSLTREQLFKAVAKNVYIDNKFVVNPYKLWSDIDVTLPDSEILIYGPPPTSGTRDAFVELINLHVCTVDYNLDEKVAKNECSSMREDGIFVEAGENDNLIVQKLIASPESLGILGFSFLDQNGDKIQGTIVDGVVPSFESISDGSYSLSRSLYFYTKDQHMKDIPGFREFVEHFMSSNMIGPDAKTVDKGLIPLRPN